MKAMSSCTSSVKNRIPRLYHGYIPSILSNQIVGDISTTWSSEYFNALSLYFLDETSSSVKTKLDQLLFDVKIAYPLLGNPRVIAASYINGPPPLL
jgi:hypothetical protein